MDPSSVIEKHFGSMDNQKKQRTSVVPKTPISAADLLGVPDPMLSTIKRLTRHPEGADERVRMLIITILDGDNTTIVLRVLFIDNTESEDILNCMLATARIFGVAGFTLLGKLSYFRY